MNDVKNNKSKYTEKDFSNKITNLFTLLYNFQLFSLFHFTNLRLNIKSRGVNRYRFWISIISNKNLVQIDYRIISYSIIDISIQKSD